MNTFGSLAVAGMLVMGGAAAAGAADVNWDGSSDITVSTDQSLSITERPTLSENADLTISGGTVKIDSTVVMTSAKDGTSNKLSMSDGKLVITANGKTNINAGSAQFTDISVTGGSISISGNENRTSWSDNGLLLSYSINEDTTFKNTEISISNGTLFACTNTEHSMLISDGTRVTMDGQTGSVIRNSGDGKIIVTGDGTHIDVNDLSVISSKKTEISNNAKINIVDELHLVAFLPKESEEWRADYTVTEALNDLPTDVSGTFTVTSGASLNVAQGGTLNIHNVDMNINGGSLNIDGTTALKGNINLQDGSLKVAGALNVDYSGQVTGNLNMTGGELTVTGNDAYVQVLGLKVTGGTVTVSGRTEEGALHDALLLSYAAQKDADDTWSQGMDTIFSGPDTKVVLDGGTIFGAMDNTTDPYETKLRFENGVNVELKGETLNTAGVIYASAKQDASEAVALEITGTGTQVTTTGYGVISAGQTTVSDGAHINVGSNGQLNLAAFLSKDNTVTDAVNSLGNLNGAFNVTSGAAINVAQNGTLNIHNVDTTIGDTATLSNNGTINITNRGSLTLKDGSSTIVTAGSMINNSGRMTVENGAKLTIADAVAGGSYTVVSGSGDLNFGDGNYTDSTFTGWKDDNLQASSDMVILTSDDGRTFTAQGQDAHDVFTGLDDGMANAVNDLYTGHDGAAGEPRWDYANVDSADMGVRFLSRATDNHFLGADKDAAAATIESAARIAFAGAVPQMTKMASDAGTNAVVNRLGFANPADGAQAMDAEGKIVDRNTTGFALWIAPLWQSQHGWGMEADNLDYGFNGNLGGVSLGADYTFENAIRAGITFNIGGGYAESSGGDLNSTENRMSFWGLGAYAGWNYENFGLMADVSYTSTWNDLKQDMDSRMGMGDLEADVQASAISAGLRAEYKLETSVLDVIPHIGVRYMSLNTWGFDAESNGGTVLEGDGFHQDIWTFPVGVTFTKDFTLDSGWSFKPSIDFSVIPAAGDIKAKQDVAFTGLPGSYEVETQMMDYLTWQGGVGLELGNDTMSFGVNYTLQAGQHTTGHGVFGSFRYEF